MGINDTRNDLVEKYFEVVEYDNNRKPLKLKSLDYGIKYFVNPASIYSNQKLGDGLPPLPIVIQGDNSNEIDELKDLESQGWTRLQ